MAHRGTRSDEAIIRRAAKHAIYSNAFVDRKLGEVVSRTSQEQVLEAVNQEVPAFTGRSIPELPEMQTGIVLHDQTTTGVFDDQWPPTR